MLIVVWLIVVLLIVLIVVDVCLMNWWWWCCTTATCTTTKITFGTTTISTPRRSTTTTALLATAEIGIELNPKQAAYLKNRDATREMLKTSIFPADRLISKHQSFGGEHGPFDTRASIIPRSIAFANSRNAAKTRSKAAGHRCFQRQPAWHASRLANLCDRFHHGLRTAAINVRSQCLSI